MNSTHTSNLHTIMKLARTNSIRSLRALVYARARAENLYNPRYICTGISDDSLALVAQHSLIGTGVWSVHTTSRAESKISRIQTYTQTFLQVKKKKPHWCRKTKFRHVSRACVCFVLVYCIHAHMPPSGSSLWRILFQFQCIVFAIDIISDVNTNG